MSQNNETTATSEYEFEREAAVVCFNKAWDLPDKRNRSQEEDAQMLVVAHASRYHWGNIEKPDNRATGDRQISRIYAELRQPTLSLLLAKSALDACEKNNLSETLVSAYEGLARAHAIANDSEKANCYVGKARQQLGTVKDEDDRKIYAQRKC
jgi:hypothetical protein